MEPRAVFGALLSLMFLGLPRLATSFPAQCLNWEDVYPCPCLSVIDEDGIEQPSVDCSSKSLTAVPQPKRDYFQTLYELRLNDNNLVTLPADAFQGIKIERLDLTGNSMGDIDENAFRGTENDMIVLKIEGNSIALPQNNALRKLIHLQELTMKNYNVAHLSDSANDLYFLSFRDIQKLTLDNWGIESIAEGAFFAAENRHTLKSLALLNQKLTSIPIDVLRAPELQNLQSLRISHTQINAITAYAFSALNSLTEIILSNNEINSIEEDSFQGVGDTLQKIDFSHNFIGSGQHNDLPYLKDLSSLKELSLSNNEFGVMPKMENLGNGEAFHLDFSQNKLRALSANDLASYISRLEGLDLTQNEITLVDDNTFSGATKLSSFILTLQGGNSGAALNVPTSLTNAAGSLNYLDLSGQTLDQTGLWQTIGQLRNLQTLIMHSAELNSIPDFAFQNLAALKKLDLSYNERINQLTDKTFVGPRMIRTLILRAIGITAIPTCLFHNQIGDLSLDLGSTVITCDCTVRSLLDRFINGSVTFPDNQSIPTCSDTTMLTQRNPSDFETCDPEECANYITTQSPNQPSSSLSTDLPSPPPVVQIQLQATKDSIAISWDLSDSGGFMKYRITVLSPYQIILDIDIISEDTTQQNVPNLQADTNYLVCVYAHFTSIATVSNCDNIKTTADDASESSSSNMGIIIGCVVGVLVLLAILAVIVYLLVIRRRPQKTQGPPPMAGPMQPRTFTKSELPTMNGDSRSFVKAKKNGSKDLKPTGGMQVVAISDGQTRPSAGRVGRAHLLASDGTYEPMDKPKSQELDYEPMKKPFGSQHGTDNAAYENDRGSLPPTPRKKQFESNRGTDNAAYENDSGSLPPTPKKKQFEPNRGKAVNAAYENDRGSLPPTPRKKQFEHSQGTVNVAYENDGDSLPPTPRRTQFDPRLGVVNGGFENDHGSHPSSPVHRHYNQRSPRSPRGHDNEAFTQNRYDEITV